MPLTPRCVVALALLALLVGGTIGCPPPTSGTGAVRADGLGEAELERIEYWGSWGTIDGKFERPRTLAVHDPWLFVIDKTGRVQRFDTRTGEHDLSWHLPFDNSRPLAPEDPNLADLRNPDGSLPGDVMRRVVRGYPVGCAIDTTTEPATLLVVHTHYQQVLRYSLDGELIGSFGHFGEEPGGFVFPVHVVVRERDGHLFVAEYGMSTHRIQEFTPAGELVSAMGGPGEEPGRFARPNGLTFAPASDGSGEQHLYVCDAINHRIQELTEDGRFVAEFGRFGAAPGELRVPYGIVYHEPSDRLIVAEFENARLSVFTRQGQCTGTLGQLGRGPGEFANVWDLALGNDGRTIYAPDYRNHRVAVIPVEIVPGLTD